MKAAIIDGTGFRARMLAARPASAYFAAPGKTPVHQADGLFAATLGNALFAHGVLALDLQSMRIDVRVPG